MRCGEELHNFSERVNSGRLGGRVESRMSLRLSSASLATGRRFTTVASRQRFACAQRLVRLVHLVVLVQLGRAERRRCINTGCVLGIVVVVKRVIVLVIAGDGVVVRRVSIIVVVNV